MRHRLPALAATVIALGLSAAAGADAAPTLDLDHLSGAQAEKLLQDGSLTSVELTQAYLDRIAALNKSAPALNAVTQLNADALQQAADADALRKKGVDLGPAMGLPIVLKDIVDAKGQYTSAGNYSLRDSYPAKDSGVTAYLRQRGVIILGKVGLSEFANYFGGQPSGFSNLTGQVLNANDADATPSGSSSGTGAAIQASLSSLGIGTETSGSIISPSQAEGIVGLRPTVGLVPGYGIAPIIASQDTAGPMERTVTDAAMTLQSITGTDPAIEAEAAQEYKDVFGEDYIAKGILPARPASIPDYMSALRTDFVSGKRIGYTGTAPADCAAVTPTPITTTTTAFNIAFCALKAAGATMVPVTNTTTITYPGITGVEAHVTIDGYYKHLGPDAPVKSMADETADNAANPLLALKFNNATHWNVFQSDDSVVPLAANRASLSTAKIAIHTAFDNVFNRGNTDPTDDVIGVIGSLSNAPQAGYPQITVPMGYSPTQRRANNINTYGPAYSERDLIGIAYVMEQATKLRQTAEELNPSMYRCAKLPVPAPYAARGACNPDYKTTSDAAGSTLTPDLGFKLETATVAGLQSRMAAGTLTSVALTRAYLNRIALTNAQGPGLQAVRALNADALAAAKAADEARDAGRSGSMLGIPVLLDDSYDVAGMTTTAGSIALQKNKPDSDSALVAKLKKAGAVILGKTNVTEFNNVFDTNITAGYSSLGGQVLTSYDTDIAPGGSSAGSASALSSGLAAVTIGLQSSQSGITTAGATDGTLATASAVLPASVMGVAALKPTVGRTSRVGVLGAAKSQDSPTPMALSISGLADAMNAVAGIDPSDTETVATGATPANYAAGLGTSLAGRTINVLPTTTAADTFTVPSTPGYDDAITALTAAGATASTRTISSLAADQPATPASVLPREFRRDLNAYLASGHSGAAGSLADVVASLTENPTEGLKYATVGTGAGAGACATTGPIPGALCAALGAANIGPSGVAGDLTAYSSDLSTGRTSYQAYLSTQLAGGDALLVPAGSPLVGYADRAGYPVLEMQSGYRFTGSAAAGYQATHDPYGVALIGAADSEATLLKDAYAIEQKLNTQTSQSIPLSTPAEKIAPGTTAGQYVYSDAHSTPSENNPAMFRCIAGSVYYAPYKCHPGEIGYVSPVKAPTAVPPAGTPTTTTTPGTAPVVTPAPPANAAATALDKKQLIALKQALKTKLSLRSGVLTVRDRFLDAGRVTYTLRVAVTRKGTRKTLPVRLVKASA
ncbi:MAG: Asp-tRNAAsn/Glu-tRNAGln amidotransferase subunit, partial [Solirubrobacterales bacterium]|nr:Asp-tRNAAsn/Glu-tRNAGln amidotransferase subunit [Solirubrobacterales bacterium]